MGNYRFACDTGGTFTDLLVETPTGEVKLYKASTVPSDPISGVLQAFSVAANGLGMSLEELLGKGDVLIHGTTHSLNAVVTGNVAKTAFLVTEGHKDMLFFREGGRDDPFEFSRAYPQSYIPRSLTFEVKERIGSSGEIVRPLDEEHLREQLLNLKEQKIEAIAICLVWSIVNAEHELRIAELIEEVLPYIPYTLSHQLNPILREFRRGASTAMDASLKPLMGEYLGNLSARIEEAGFDGDLMVLTSQGGMMSPSKLAKAPIHSINSGPSMAPLAGRKYAADDCGFDTVIVADTGGTTFDVSLVQRGDIPRTKDLWIGDPFYGHMTGFPSIEVKSVGAGGGSIAWIDGGGLLRLGPQSAGAVPGPACYGQGGLLPTITDSALVLGYFVPDAFMAGSKKLDIEAARSSINKEVAGPLGMSTQEAAQAMMDLATENMVQAISEITVRRGIDPTKAVLVGGGGAGGLNAVAVAKRLGCKTVLIPRLGAALSAAGALLSDMTAGYRRMLLTSSDDFDHKGVNDALNDLSRECQNFISEIKGDPLTCHSVFKYEARYEGQVWEVEVPLSFSHIGEVELPNVIEAFHQIHEELFSFRDENARVEFIAWTVQVYSPINEHIGAQIYSSEQEGGELFREVYHSGEGPKETRCINFSTMKSNNKKEVGPMIIDSSYTTVVVPTGATAHLGPSGGVVIELGDDELGVE